MNVYHKSFCPLSIQISFWEQNTHVPPLSPAAPAIKFGKLPRVITDESKKKSAPGKSPGTDSIQTSWNKRGRIAPGTRCFFSESRIITY